jgi:transposase
MGCTAFARLHFVQEELRNILSTLLYIASTGCHWRMLPKEFPRLA